MPLSWYDYFTMNRKERQQYRVAEGIRDNLKELVDLQIKELELGPEGTYQAGDITNKIKGLTSKLQESAIALGNPWWADAIGLFPDQQWRQGFPAYNANFYGTDANTIVRSDTLRWQNLMMCRNLYDNHPHGRGAINNALFFVCGSTGWSIDPTPYKPDPKLHVEPVMESQVKRCGIAEDVAYVGKKTRIPPVIRAASFNITPKGDYAPSGFSRPIDATLQGTLREKWKEWARRGVMHPQLGWYQFCRELTMRLYRDGEVFIFKGHDKKTGDFTPRFLEPECIKSPADCMGDDDLRITGVEVDKEDEQKVIAYWYQPLNKRNIVKPYRIDAKLIMHLKYNTDSGMKRGLPLLFTARAMLRHYDLWIMQAIKIQRIQGQIAILRQWESGDENQLASLLQSQTQIQANISTPAGNQIQYKATDQFPIIDAPAGMTMTPWAPRGNFGDSDILARRLELAVCAATTQSEAMISADGSNANYSSTRITQFIPLRGFEADQGYIGENMEELYECWLRAKVAMQDVKRLKPDQYHCTWSPAQLPNFEGELNIPLAATMQQTGLFSNDTIYKFLRMDGDAEKEKLDEQTRDQMQRQKAAMKAQAQQQQDQLAAQGPIQPVGADASGANTSGADSEQN